MMRRSKTTRKVRTKEGIDIRKKERKGKQRDKKERERSLRGKEKQQDKDQE